MAILEFLSGEQAGHQLNLTGETAVLGRHPDCNIVLDQGAVSRQHAAISLIDGEYHVEDLNSRNGTFVNGSPVHEPLNLQTATG